MVDCFVVVLLCNAALVVSVLSAPPSGRLKQRSVSALPPRRSAKKLFGAKKNSFVKEFSMLLGIVRYASFVRRPRRAGL